jgi:hypothetical protein
VKRWFIAVIGTKEILLREEPTRVRRFVERWIRLFWQRWVERTASSGLGVHSLAYEIESDPSVAATIILCGEGASPRVVGIERAMFDTFSVAEVLNGRI